MSLKDRLRSKKEAKTTEKGELCEFNISIKKVTEAVAKTKDPGDLGNIVKEFAKFLNTLPSSNTKIVFSGNFDLGQKTLLNCILSNFLEEEKIKVKLSLNDENEELEEKKESKLVKKRKSVRAKLSEAMNDIDSDNAEETEE